MNSATEEIPMLNLPPKLRALRDAAILTDFNGANHSELARNYGVSLQAVYRQVKQAQHEAVTSALLPVAGSEAEVIWASPLAQAHPLFVLEAGLQAFEKAKARMRAEGHAEDRQPIMRRLLVAIVVLPPDHPAVLSEKSPTSAPSAPAETPPGTPAPLDTSPVH